MAPFAGAAEVSTLDEPRAYGHVIGDLIEREAQLDLPAGQTLAPDGLPRPGRVDAWLELQSVSLAARAGGQRLRLTYQVVNVGPEVVTTVLPALRLALLGGAPGDTVSLPDWPVHLSPLTPRFAVARAGLDALQPDIAPVREPLAPMLARLAGGAALALLLASPLLAARWPGLVFWRRQAPFQRAWRDLRALRRSAASGRAGAAGGDTDTDTDTETEAGADTDTETETEAGADTDTDTATRRRAIARLHAAFDASAGQAVFAQQLEPLFLACPALRRAAAEIDAFYAASRRAFFARAGSDPRVEAASLPSLPQLTALARTLARLEGLAR